MVIGMALIAGTLLALGAAGLFGLAAILQVPPARSQPARLGMRPGLLWALARSRRWLAGAGAGVGGWLLQAAALTLAPLTVVQPALAVSLPVILFLAPRRLGERAGRRQWLAVAATIAGVAAIAASAPHRSPHEPAAATLALTAVALAAVLVAPPLLRRRHHDPVVLALWAGTAFAVCGIATKLATDSTGELPRAIGWLALTAAAAGFGGTAEMTALRTGAASVVVPLVFAAETVLPVAAAPAVFGETWTGLGPLALLGLAGGLVALLCGAIAVARAPRVTAAIAAAQPAATPVPIGQATPVPPSPQ